MEELIEKLEQAREISVSLATAFRNVTNRSYERNIRNQDLINDYRAILEERINLVKIVKDIFKLNKLWLPESGANISWDAMIITKDLSNPEPIESYEEQLTADEGIHARYIIDDAYSFMYNTRMVKYVSIKYGRNEMISEETYLSHFKDDYMTLIKPASVEEFEHVVRRTAAESKILLLKMAKSVDDELANILNIIKPTNNE